MSIPTPFLALVMVSLAFAGCGGPTDFGKPVTLSADQRPTIWDAKTRSRLRVRQMGAARSSDTAPAAKRWEASPPAGWSELPPEPARFRDLQWKIEAQPEVECYFTAGVGGGITSNIQRWYGQFGLSPQSPDGLPTVSFAGGQGRLLELRGSFRGKDGQAMLLAFRMRGDLVSSLKMTGPAAGVDAARDAFLALAASIHEKGGGSEGGAANAIDDPFAADVPAEAGWRPVDSPKSQHYRFGERGEVYVSELSGDAQKMSAIWRQAMGLEPLTEAEFDALPKWRMLGGDAVVLDMSGTLRLMSGGDLPDARMIVVLRSEGNAITFAKLLGSKSDIDEAQVDAFEKFCASLRRNP